MHLVLLPITTKNESFDLKLFQKLQNVIKTFYFTIIMIQRWTNFLSLAISSTILKTTNYTSIISRYELNDKILFQ